MSRQTINFLLDALLALLGLAVLATGLLIAYILPPHSRGDWVWGWTRHDWGELHLYLALGLVGMIALHLAMHWRWVCVVGAKVLARLRVTAGVRTQAGLALAIVLLVGLILGGFLYAAAASKVSVGPQHRHRQATLPIPQSVSPPPAPAVEASSGRASSIDTPGPSAS
ncbi:MAG: DUF4405 domain-containing protein [Planctomycetes bacterium]|jgi:hypothetical protein|nr:DUF4405 domain-containing protein [Planctomycetota bacterium]